MKAFKRIMLVFLSFSLIVQCDKCDPCDGLYLADLAFGIVNIVNPQIALGAELVLKNKIVHLEQDCERQRANESSKKVTAEYRADNDSPWEDAYFTGEGNTTTYEVIVPTKALDEGEEASYQENYKFGTVGQYKFDLEADTYDVVDESNEQNNTADTEPGTVSNKNGSNSLIVVVYDPTNSGKGKRKKGSPVIIEYLGSKEISE